MRHAEHIDNAGLILDMVQIPLPSGGIERNHQAPGIVLGRPGERDREIDGICRIIEALAEAGYRCRQVQFQRARHSAYHVGNRPRRRGSAPPGVPTRPRMRIRSPSPARLPQTSSGSVSSTFSSASVPVATVNRVRLACHPHDPMTLPGFRGFEKRVLASAEGLMRFVQIRREAPITASISARAPWPRALENPREEIGEIIRWFGEPQEDLQRPLPQHQEGGRYSFTEEFPDNGDMDMPATAKIYKEVGYDAMIMPDHVPHIDADNSMETAFAFCFGYIIGVFQANGWDPYGAAISGGTQAVSRHLPIPHRVTRGGRPGPSADSFHIRWRERIQMDRRRFPPPATTS